MPYYADSLYYRDRGKGDVAIVLVHGWYQNGDQAWGSLVPELSDRYRLFVPDLPGHGLNPEIPAHFSPQSNIELLAGFITYLRKTYRLKKIFLAGHSYGAYATLALASQYADLLSGVMAFAAVDDYAPYKPRLKWVLAVPRWLEGLYYRLQAALAQFPYGDRLLLYANVPSHLVPGKLEYAKIKNRVLSISASRAYMKTFMKSKVEWPREPLSLPIFLGYGDRDNLTSAKWAKHILPHFSGGTMEVIADAGHNVQISGASDLAREIRRFVEKCLRPAAAGKDGKHARRRS